MKEKVTFMLRPKHAEYVRAMAAIKKMGISDMLKEIIEEYRKNHEIGADEIDTIKR